VTQTRPAASSRRSEPAKPGRPGVALFYRQAVAELRKVVWPTREQLVTYFAVVLAFVLVMILVVSVFDFVFGTAIFKIFG
jgi:preprotein translocase subunit SecE